MANSEDVLERAIDWYCDDKTLLYHRGSILRDLIDHVRELRVKLDSEAGHRLSLCADNERFVAEVLELRQKLAEPWRHFPCPETQQPCGRMCLSMCHRRSDLIGELRRERDEEHDRRLDWRGIDPGDKCSACGGAGSRAYGSTATWRGGIGGRAITSDVCNRCWGSGSKTHRWPSHRAAMGGGERERREQDDDV